MPAPPMPRHSWLFAGIAVLLVAAPAAAAPPLAVLSRVDEAATNPFEWTTPFSLWRWVLFGLGVAVSWFVAFNVLMLSALALENPRPPRPKEAFARAAGWFVLFTAVSLVAAFAVASNDLYRKPWVKWFPSPLTPLNHHILWIAALVLGVVLMFLVRSIFRR